MNATGQTKNLAEKKFSSAKVDATVTTIVLGIMTLTTAPLAIYYKNFSGYILAAALLISTLLGIAGTLLIRHKQVHFGISLIINAFQLAMVMIAVVIQGVGIPVAISIVVLTVAAALMSLEEKDTTVLIVTAIIASFLSLIAGTLPYSINPLNQISSPWLIYGAYGFMASVVVFITVLFIRKYIVLTLLVKLLVAFVVITLVPVGIIAFVSITTSTNVVKDQANQSLLIAGKETASFLNLFVENSLTAVQTEALNPSIVNFVNLTAKKGQIGSEQTTVQNVLQSLLAKDPIYLLSYALLDKNGMDILDTNLNGLGLDESRQDYFQNVTLTQKAYITPIEYVQILISANGGNNTTGVVTETAPVIIFSAPIFNGNGDLIGVIRAQYKASVLLDSLKNNQNMVKTGSYPILFDETRFRIADPVHPNDVNKFLVLPSADLIQSLRNNAMIPNLANKQLTTNQPLFLEQLKTLKDNSFFTTSELSNGQKEMGVAVFLTARPWTVLYLQKEATVLQPVTQQTQTTLLLVYIIAAVTGILSILVANWIAHPITVLTITAQRISSGDLQAQAEVKSGDEIELLSRTFNLMTAQLRTFISGLEERVQQRTQELAQQTQRAVYRAAQIQTLADVARAVTSVQDLEELLQSVTKLTSERFNFYHVGIFLIDPAGEYAILRAANSEGGQRMLARQHRLKIGQVGIVGNVAASLKPRMATDVGQDATYFNNPDLPLTRSEMALPLMSGGKVIGVLDVQSTVTNAFTEDDLSLFSTLADQVAVAIVNNSLYAETRLALAEAQEVHRKYLRREWDTEISENRMQGYQYDMHGLTSIDWQNSAEIDIAIRRGETVTVSHTGDIMADADSQSRSALAVPIKLRGEVIGVIDLQDTDVSREWFKEEIEVVQAVADQVAVALENARLFEQTVRRAEREKKVLDITGKIRSSNDPQVMIKTAISELQQVLRASRAQILLQPSQPADETEAPGSNHRNNGHHAQ